MEPKVSIIVPVYNSEKYIGRCIESIIDQEFTDFELLVADDGSTDGTGKILDGYAKKDKRIKVFHRENSGVSASRNFCLDNAVGEYIQFLDADDWITPDATRLFVWAATEGKADMVIADFYRVIGDRLAVKGDIEEDGVMTRDELAAQMMENPADFYYGVLWNKLFKREIIEKYGLRMDPKVSWCEDFLFNLEYIRHADVFYALHTPIYYYVKTKGSLVSQGASFTNTVRMKTMVFEYYNNFYKKIWDEEDYEKNKRQLYRFFFDMAKDGGVAPAILPWSKKLGSERNEIYDEAVSEEGIVMDAYRDRKLLEYYLEPVAMRNDLTLEDVKLLLYVGRTREIPNRQFLADFVGMSKREVNQSLQRLSMKGYIRVEEVKKTKDRDKHIKIETVRKFADDISRDLAVAENDYDNARFLGLTEEEIVSYAAISEKIKGNIQRILT
ncbi:MAG: glycosyltransferase [Acetatifactor sp.]|nr:glycosyltransferase [Acetatifactor sp.]